MMIDSLGSQNSNKIIFKTINQAKKLQKCVYKYITIYKVEFLRKFKNILFWIHKLILSTFQRKLKKFNKKKINR